MAEYEVFPFTPIGNVKTVITWGGQKHQFLNGAVQMKRSKIHPTKHYQFSIGLDRAMWLELSDFYNRHQGALKPFIFNYNGVEEICCFSGKLQQTVIRELGRIVGAKATIEVDVIHDSSVAEDGEEGAMIPVKPYGEIEQIIDWNTNILDMGARARKKTYDEPLYTLKCVFSGTAADRDNFVKFYESYGDFKACTVNYNDGVCEVLFPSTIEITDITSLGKIVGFQTEVELTSFRRPNNGSAGSGGGSGISSVKRVSLKEFAMKGYVIDGVCYKDCMWKLSRFKITNCYKAFEGSDLTEIPWLDTSECTDFSRMFMNSKITHIEEFDTSNGTQFNSMFNGSSVVVVKSLDVSNATSGGCQNVFFNSSVRNVYNIKVGKYANKLFYGAKNLESVGNIVGLNNAVDTREMFSGCSILYSIPTITLGSATNTSQMFKECTALSSVNISGMKNVTRTDGMFYGDRRLSSVNGVDLTNAYWIDQWGHVEGIIDMFKNCNSMSAITVIDDNVTYEQAILKYKVLVTNYGLFDGRYNGRYLQTVTVITKDGTFTLRRGQELSVSSYNAAGAVLLTH